MNKANKLPNFIDVANIRDLFWNNNSDLYPSCVPTGYHRVEKTRPVFVTPYVGTCVLDGELNHCIYNGEYYFLTKLEILDIEKLRYKYQLDYDVMINFMVRGVDVTGTLIKTNRPDILEGCLQTTVPILADPVQKRVYGKPIDSKETWQQKLKVDLFSVDTIRKNFEEWTITKENYQAFIRRVENNILGQGTKDKQWLADTVIGGFNEYAHQNPLFILDSLPIDRTFNKWKLLLSYEIAKFFEETKKEDLIITKQVTPSDHFNVGGYVVGKKDNTIGQNIVSEVTLSRIDLSGLTDIVPMENKAKRDMEPNRKPTYEMLPHTQKISAPPNIYALLRKPYLPIGSARSIDGCISAPADGVKDYCEIGLLGGNNTPQKVVTNDNRTGYLWYLNKNNLALIDEEDDNLKSLGCKFSTSTWTGTYARWGFFSAQYKNIAPIGFMIYQVLKRNTEWDDIEHTGEGVTTLFFRTGLRQSTINKRYVVDADKYWWGYADQDLLKLWGDSELSRVQLDLDQFNWLSIAPSDDGYTYKYHYGNYWNYKKFFPSAGDRQIGYPSMLNRMNIEFNGKEIVNPYSYGDPDTSLPGWLTERERKIDAISMYGQVDIDTGIKKGDIFTTSLEHGWYNMDELTRLLFPYNISTAEWQEWSAKDYGNTINLGVDEYAEYRSQQKRITAVGATVVSIGILAILLAPFTAGGSIVAAVALSTPGLVSLGTGAAVLASQPSYSSQFKSSVISTLPYSNPNYQVDPGLMDGTIVLYLYRGKYRIGIYKKKSTTLSLDDDEDNLIKTVDGTSHRDLDLMLIRPLEHGLLDYKQAPIISETLKQEIIEFGLGNRDNLTPLDKTHYYSPNDLKVGTHTFDLRGTGWYLVMHNGTMNFVPKSTSVFNNIEDEGQLIDIKDDVSTYAKINQKADLNYYGQVFKLNTKFNFDGTFSYVSKPLVLEKEFADPDVEYKWLLVKEQNDDIDEVLTLPRKETRHAEVVDSSQVLMMKERLLQISSNYEQDKYANELMIGDKRLALARQREDLNWMHTSSGVNLGLKTVGSILGTSLFKKDSLMLAGAAGIAGSMKSDVEFLLKYPMLMKRVDEDEKNLMLANSQQLYQRKQNYEHDFKFQTLKLNKIAGSYQKAGVSNRDAQEKYNKERGVSDVNVEIFLPSPVQQKQIDYIYETFGCECISDHFEYTPLSIRDNMPSGIYQFSRIESGGIQSAITDTTLREILRRILENGVKFQGCTFEIEPWETKPIHVVLPKRPKIVFDPGNIKDWSIEKWDTYKIKTDRKEIIDTLKKVPQFGLSDEEWNKHKDLFKDIKDDQIIDLINKVIADRETGETVIIALPKESDPEKDSLNKTITDLRDKVAKLEAEIAANQQSCDSEKERLNSEKQAIQEQLNACQQRVQELSKAKTDKEGEIGVIQDTVSALSLEKADLLKKLKECNDMIKRLRQMQATCDRVNTQKIKDLEAQIRECQQEKQDCKDQLDKVKTELAANKQKLTQLQGELERCNTEDAVKQVEITALKRQLEEKQGQLEGRPTQEAIDALKAEYEATKKRLEAEIHQHKVDKEDLTQQLNNERVRAINEKDEINRLKKQIEDSKGDRDKIAELEEKIQEIELEKAYADERIAAKQRELEQCRIELDLAKKAQPKKEYKPQVADECTLWLNIVRDPYTYDIKTRDNGWNAFLDLVFELAQALRWEGKTELDQRLMKIPEIRPVLERLEELKNVPIIDKAIDTMNEAGWSKYLTWLEKGGDLNGSVDGVIAKVNAIKAMENQPNIHAVKALLDELNWQSYKAKNHLTEQLKTNEDLQTLFTHIYPGKSLDLYKALYGDHNWAIIRKRFTEELKCTAEGGGSMVEWADHYRKTTSYGVGDITKPTTKPKETQGGVRLHIRDNLIFTPNDSAKYRQVRNILPNFNEAVKGHWVSESQTDYTWLIWNYVYNRYIKNKPELGSKGLIWLKQKVGSQEQIGRYIWITYDFSKETYGSPSDICKRTADLWNDRGSLKMQPEIISAIRDGSKTLTIVLQVIPTFTYSVIYQKYTFSRQFISEIDALGLLEDLIKMMCILRMNRYRWYTEYRDASDDYVIYKPLRDYSALRSDKLVPNIPTNVQDISLGIGWLFPSEHVYDADSGLWYDVFGKGHDGIGYNTDTAVYQFVRWFYEIATGAREFIHPLRIGAGGAYAFMDAIWKIGHNQ